MSRNLPPLNALRAFEAAARHQHFSRAAEELNVSHSAISRHVRGLEHRLNVRLFRDEARGVALTSEGARYLAFVGPALDQIAEATEELRERPQGVVVLNSEPSFALRWLTPRLGGFYAAHPEVELRLEASSELIDVARYEADLAVRFRKSGEALPGSDLLSNLPLYPYAAPDVAAKIRQTSEILHHKLLQDRNGDTWAQWFAIAGGAAPGEPAAPSWRLSVNLAIEAAVAGQGVILCGSDLVLDAAARGDLVKCVDIPLYLGAYYLVQREGGARNRAVRAFRDWLLHETKVLRISAET